MNFRIATPVCNHQTNKGRLKTAMDKRNDTDQKRPGNTLVDNQNRHPAKKAECIHQKQTGENAL